MAEQKAQDRFIQTAAEIEITNIPPNTVAFVKAQQERREKEQQEKPK